MPYTPELGLEICQGLEDGESLLSVCRRLNLKESTVRFWTRENAEFSANYARAREDGDDIEFERLAELQSEQPPLDQYGKVDPGWVNWQKNRVDTAKWMLARKRPKKYSDKVDVELSGSVVIKRVITDL